MSGEKLTEIAQYGEVITKMGMEVTNWRNFYDKCFGNLTILQQATKDVDKFKQTATVDTAASTSQSAVHSDERREAAMLAKMGFSHLLTQVIGKILLHG